eukprot:TRINITY_DN4303_c0_g1_i1.p1 TRINITY_DN4303_c0_g1~~TRINITY_DN4303_c0_g1_i1.p1  ORF type:complete len:195 (+),score=12.09 TRINITY_DN4303_c0_g1_i1:72-656(+)
MAPLSALCPPAAIKPQADNGAPTSWPPTGSSITSRFGSNMCAETLVSRSMAGALSPSWSERAYLPNWHLAFDLIGAPPTEPLMASIVPCRAATTGAGTLRLGRGVRGARQWRRRRGRDGGGGRRGDGGQLWHPPPPAPPPRLSATPFTASSSPSSPPHLPASSSRRAARSPTAATGCGCTGMRPPTRPCGPLCL